MASIYMPRITVEFMSVMTAEVMAPGYVSVNRESSITYEREPPSVVARGSRFEIGFFIIHHFLPVYDIEIHVKPHGAAEGNTTNSVFFVVESVQNGWCVRIRITLAEDLDLGPYDLSIYYISSEHGFIKLSDRRTFSVENPTDGDATDEPHVEGQQ